MQIKINERLKEVRAKKRLTQASVADTIGISRTSYQSYEEGRAQPSIETLIALSSLYCFSSINELLGHAKPSMHPLVEKYAVLGEAEKKIVDFILNS